MSKTDAPHVFVEPPIPTATEFTQVDHVRSVINQLDRGSFRMPSLLLERMLWNPRFRSVVETRLAGLIATDVRFEPRRNTPDCQRAARELTEDWKEIASGPMRKQMWQASLLLGFGLAQRPEDVAFSGRTIYKLRPYWTGFATYVQMLKAYRIQTMEGATNQATPSVDRKEVERFALSVLDKIPTAQESPWVVAEPFGVNSYRNAIIHAAWRPVLGHDWATRDQSRNSEKNGIGIMIAEYPRGTGEEHKASLQLWLRGLKTMGSEGIIPCEVRGKDEGSFGARPFEYSGAGGQAITDSQNANAVALAILMLGHNLTTEIKGGGSYAAAGVADYIRDDKKAEDSDGEWSYLLPQLVVPWAIANYDDPSVAPVARYITNSPAVTLQRAQMIYQLSMAVAQLRANLPRTDLNALAEEFRLPMLTDDKLVMQVAAHAETLDPAAAGMPTTPGMETTDVNTDTEATLSITATDLASIVTVNEGRDSIGLDPIAGPTGDKWIREHAAKLAATLPVDPAEKTPAPGKQEAAQ